MKKSKKLKIAATVFALFIAANLLIGKGMMTKEDSDISLRNLTKISVAKADPDTLN